MAEGVELVVNGRFRRAPLTGVQRVATELTAAIAELTEGDQRWSLTEATPPRWAEPGVRGHLWEQTLLPRRARAGMLLNLANTAPIRAEPQILLLCDAQVIDRPESYSSAMRRWYRFMLPRAARSAELVLTISEHSRQRLAATGLADLDHTVVVPLGVDHIVRAAAAPTSLERFRLDPGSFFLMVGAAHSHKNLARVAGAAQATGQTLVVVGEPPETKPTGVQFVGKVGDASLRALYESAIALVHPSLDEGFGLPPLEALRCGCRVLASDAGALPETLGDHAELLPDDDRAWTAAMQRAADDPTPRAGVAAISYAEQFTWERAASDVLAHIASTLGAD